jgi:hypothetical protein
MSFFRHTAMALIVAVLWQFHQQGAAIGCMAFFLFDFREAVMDRLSLILHAEQRAGKDKP